MAGSFRIFDDIEEYCGTNEINRVDACGLTPLMWAAINSDVKACKELIRLGADSRKTITHNAKTMSQRSVLFQKLEDPTMSNMRNLMVDKGAWVEDFEDDLDADCPYGNEFELLNTTWLTTYVENIANKTAHEKKDYFNCQTCSFTAVDYAALFNKDKGVAKYLLARLWWDKFTKRGTKFPEGLKTRDLIETCANAGMDLNEMVKSWIDNAKVFQDYSSPWFWWMRNEKFRKSDACDLAYFIDKYGFDLSKIGIDQKNFGITPLMLAAEYGDVHAMKTILPKSGEIVNKKGEKGKSALLYALFNYNNETNDFGKCISMLLDNRADVDVRVEGEREEFTPMTVQEAAVRHVGDRKLLVRLIRKEDVNTVNERGETLLMFAAKFGNENAAKYLLENGCSVTNTIEQGRWRWRKSITAKDLARENGHDGIVKSLDENEVK